MRDDCPISTVEREFIVSALREQQRIDGRRPFDARRIAMRFLASERKDDTFFEGPSIEVKLGQTRVIAGVRAELVSPVPERPHEGTLTINLEIGSIANPTALDASRAASFEAVECQRVLERTVRESQAVDTESLCVLAGRQVWALQVTVHVLDMGGSILDACSVATLMSLLAFRVPEVTVGGGPDGSEVEVHPLSEREGQALHLHHLPLAVTFAFMGEHQDLLVMDPALKEELVATSHLTLCIDAQQEMCNLHKPGGSAISATQLMRCARIAAAQVSERTNQMKGVLSQYEADRLKNRVKRRQPAQTPHQAPGMEESLATKVSNPGGVSEVHMQDADVDTSDEDDDFDDSIDEPLGDDDDDDSEDDVEDEVAVEKSTLRTDWRSRRPPTGMAKDEKDEKPNVKMAKEELAEFDTIASGFTKKSGKKGVKDTVVEKAVEEEPLDLTAAIKVSSKSKKKARKQSG